jgi:nitroreductase
MDFYDVAAKRRTIRDFSDKEVPPEAVRRILDAGLKAPSNDHLRNWEFVVVRDKDALGAVLGRVSDNAGMQYEVIKTRKLDERQQKMYSDAIPKQYRMLSTSGCLVLPFFKHVGDLLKPKQLSSLNALAAIWCCIENILLAATAEGLACAIRIPMGDERKYVAETVGAPEDYVMACYIAIGYPAEDAVLHEQAKVSIDDKIHLNRW